MNENEIMNVDPIDEDIAVPEEETSEGSGFGLGMLIGAGVAAGAILAVTKGRKLIGKLRRSKKNDDGGDEVIDADYEDVVEEVDSE